MGQKFADKLAKVMAIEASGATRQLLTETIKDLGFANVQGVASVKDCWGILEVEPVDWIITSLMGDQPENALSLLKVCTLHPQLKSVRVSLFIEPNEKEVLKTAFELGLLSSHSKPITKDNLTKEISEFMKSFAANNWQVSLQAAEYLRKVFQETKAFSERLKLEKNLLDLNPGSPHLLINFAEAQFLSGKNQEGKSTLRQALLLAPDLEEKINVVGKKYMDPKDNLKDVAGEAKVNVLGIKTVVLVDPDSTIQRAVTDILKEIGVETIQIFNDGEEAAAWIKANPDPDLIIHEWRIPKLTGPLFIQRAVAEGAASTPLVVLSSLVKPEDMPLVKEMGVANIVQKPFDKSEFLKSIIWTVQQDKLPTESSTMERKIRSLIRGKKYKEAGEFVLKFIADETIPNARRKLIDAEYAFCQQDYLKARDCCIESIRLAGDSIFSLNLLGKVLMLLQDFGAALKCMQKAQTLSPLNIERLCQIAEVHTELGDDKTAAAVMNDAKDIDPDAQKVQEAEVNMALSKGDTEKAKKLMQNLDSVNDVVSYMNNKAVALARTGLFKEGIEEYLKTIKALPEDETEMKSRIYYNLALAYARNSDLDEAKAQVEKALIKPSDAIKKKALSLKTRIEKALNDGSDFKLTTTVEAAPAPTLHAVSNDSKDKKPEGADGSAAASPEEEEKPMSANELLVRTVLAKRGEIGCFLIYNSETPMDAMSKKCLEKLPRFKARAAIERAETLGADRNLKSA
jgi:CheY-like chemotaxis protein